GGVVVVVVVVVSVGGAAAGAGGAATAGAVAAVVAAGRATGRHADARSATAPANIKIRHAGRHRRDATERRSPSPILRRTVCVVQRFRNPPGAAPRVAQLPRSWRIVSLLPPCVASALLARRARAAAAWPAVPAGQRDGVAAPRRTVRVS